MERRNFIKNSVVASGGMILMPSIRNISDWKYLMYDNKPLKINPDLLNNEWTAQWISYPEGSLLDYG
ncbi:MAG: hypothetical protein ACRDE2_11330, partial [Chitinophagaceae bacterium]